MREHSGYLLGNDHDGCRVTEFMRWDRVMLEHERAHLSRVMAASAYVKATERDAILHELADIDWCLSSLPKRVQV